MLLYLIIGIVIFVLLFYKEGFVARKNTSCESRHKAISNYPSSLSENNEHIDVLFNAKFKP